MVLGWRSEPEFNLSGTEVVWRGWRNADAKVKSLALLVHPCIYSMVVKRVAGPFFLNRCFSDLIFNVVTPTGMTFTLLPQPIKTCKRATANLPLNLHDT